MGYHRKWKPSKTAAREFAGTMDKIKSFCYENGIELCLMASTTELVIIL